MARLTALAAAGSVLALVGCAPVVGQDAEPPAGIRTIIDQPEYEGARWGIRAVDLETGEVLVSVAPDELFLTGSVAKIFSVAAALEVLGPDHVFETPVYAIGEVAGGVLVGDLVLRASGDLTLGGRTRSDGSIEVPTFDHTDANALPGLATLTPQDPLAGLDQLAQAVHAAGIVRVDGEVFVDDRLWEPVVVGGVPISPVSVNDNLIDLLVTPAHTGGAPATVLSRPLTASITVTTDVTTGPTGSAIDLAAEAEPGTGAIRIAGSVPLGARPVVHTYQAPDPGSWARTLFIEALGRAGVAVAADPLVENPVDALPPEALLTDPVAVFVSPPFAETARLINKVSHNLGANQLPLIIGSLQGLRTLEEGMEIQRALVNDAGLEPHEVILVDGQGLPGNQVTPGAMTDYLRHLATMPFFDTLYESTPILGVDGSLASVIPADDPAVGSAHAKTGTLVSGGSETEFLLQTKALAGWMDAASGRRLAFAIFVNDVPFDDLGFVLQANTDLGSIAALLYEAY